jgi:TldD protein
MHESDLPLEDRQGLLDAALEAAKAAGARHVEARLVRKRRERLGFRDGAMEAALTTADLGLGIRALVADGWGYAGTQGLTADDAAGAARAAVAAARAVEGSSRVWVPPAVQGRYATPLAEDPFRVPLDEKAALFASAHREALAGEPSIRGTRGTLMALRVDTLFRALNGTCFDQSVTLAGGGLSVIAAANGDVQMRSYPKRDEGNVLQAGFEVIRQMGLPGEARRLAAEAAALVRAEPAPSGKRTVVLDGPQLSLQIHESVGHPTELDRVLGEEVSLAGASFLLPENLDRLVFGTEIVNLSADATTPLGPGTFGFDDEGTPASRTALVERGRLVGCLSGRDTAARLGRPSAGCLRAEGWSALPIVRMVNLNLDPGQGSLDELLGGVDDGLLLSVNKSWSIDDLRLNFQFACEAAFEVKGGRRTGRIFKNPVYYGVTPRFWGSCRAIAGPAAWQMWGWAFCGKGDPLQLAYVGHGCAPARFDGVEVGSA